MANATYELGGESTASCGCANAVIYYPGPEVVVTGHCIRADGRWYRLADLAEFETDRGCAEPTVLTSFASAVAIGLLASCVMILVRNDAERSAIGATVIAFMAVLAVVTYLIRCYRPYQLTVRHRGEGRVLLYASRNKDHFRAVVRAIGRAVASRKR